MKTTLTAMAAVAVLSIPPVWAQTMVEYATGAARAGAGAGAKGVSKSVGGVFGKVSKTLGSGEKVQGSSTTGQSKVQEVSQPTDSYTAESTPAKRRTVKPAEVETGMSRAALVQRFGKPLMKTSKMDGADFLEVFYYTGEDDMTVVTLRDGKVVAVSPPPEIPEPTTAKVAP